MGELSGMTGFARVTGEEGWGSWAWEAKSVNGRALDVRVGLPPGFEALERDVKALAAECFNRGSLQVTLRIDHVGGAGDAVIDTALLARLIKALRETSNAEPSDQSIAVLMTIKGVVETGGATLRDLAQDEAVMQRLKTGAKSVFGQLAEERIAEGRALFAVLSGHLDAVDGISAKAAESAAQQPALVRARLIKQLDDLNAEKRVDADRLAAEAALSAAKADVREELDRLAAHVRSARALLATGSPAGRKLDFLSQEMNREANTLCSKSASLDLTNAGLGLKGIIDQFKEQAANVE